MMVLLKINSKTLTKNPSAINQSKVVISQSDRTINGTLVVDIIAVKDKLEIVWDYMSDADLRKLAAEINKDTFATVDYVTGDTTTQVMKTIITNCESISYSPHYDSRTQSLMWKDVKISFIER